MTFDATCKTQLTEDRVTHTRIHVLTMQKLGWQDSKTCTNVQIVTNSSLSLNQKRRIMQRLNI